MSSLHHWSALLGALSLTACATGAAVKGNATAQAAAEEEAKKKSEFPSLDELTALGQAPPPPEDKLSQDFVPVDSWTLRSDAGLPDAIETVPVEPPQPWGAALAEVAASKPGLLLVTRAQSCMAEQLGRFYLEKQGKPADALRQFMAARCGLPDANMSTNYLSGEVRDATPDERLYESWKASIDEMVQASTAQGNRAVGLWFGRSDGRAVVAVVSSQRRVHLEKTPMRPDAGGSITLRGDLLIPAASLSALVNRGPFGVGHCEATPEVKLPRFELRCAVDARDAGAWLSVAAFPAGRLIGSTVVSAFVWPKGEPVDTWRAPRYAGAKIEAQDAGALPTALLGAINDVRKQAGLGALVLSEAQSATSSKVAPHYFAAIFGIGEETNADKVYLGLRAGWEVEGVVSHGRMTSAWTVGGSDLSGMLAAALERPSGREVLLHPKARVLAVGPVMPEGQHFKGALIATYDLFDEAMHAEQTRRIVERLTEARKARGVAAPTLLPELGETAVAAANLVQSRKENPKGAMKWFLDESASILRSAVSAWTLQASSVEDIDFPEEMLSAPTLSFSLSVAHYRDPSEPWGRVVVLVVLQKPRGATTAMLR